MSQELFGELVGAFAGIELLAAVLIVWRRSLQASARVLALQGVALAGLVAVIGVEQASLELAAVAVLVLVLKGIALPRLLARSAADEAAAGTWPPAAATTRLNPTLGLLAAVGLATLAYLVSRPIAALVPGPAGRAVPVGMTLVLTGFLVLATRRRAQSQLVGFLVLDNGIATVAFLTAGGVPLLVELGVSLDVLLVVLVLQVLSGRMVLAFGGTDLDDLKELHD